MGLCATIITMGDLPCNNGRIVRSHSKLVIHWMIIVLIRKFVLCSQPNVLFLMLDFAGDNCFLLSLWSRSYQTILPKMSPHWLFWRVFEWSSEYLS